MAHDPQLEQRFARQEHELHVHQAELEQQNEELRQINLEVELAHARYADLFEFAPIGYVVCNRAGLIMQINQAACTQLGTDVAQLIGRHFSLFVSREQRGVFTGFLKQMFLHPDAPGTHRRTEIRLTQQDGSLWDAQLEGAKLVGPQGLLARLVLTDISELKRAQRETERRTAQVQALNEELQGFVRTMNHDLTRPMRQVVGFAELLGKHVEMGDETNARYLKNLLLAASELGALTSALKRFFQSGQAGGAAALLDLNRLIEVIVHELKAQTLGRRVLVTHDPLPGVWTDHQSLHVIFSNLLDNAVKFTASCSEARIHVGVQSTPEHHLFSVRDNGVGFASQHRDRLFTVFGRLHSDRLLQGQAQGLGLGLALVRRVVQRLHGEVWAESVPGEGSTFWVQLPREAAPPQEPESWPDAQGEVSGGDLAQP